ncbi:MAG: hypothetical protein KDI37_07400 [Xanthomonadales bacterium]|nr:hypothetical protein [Xanthomonadales bacterium]MCB1641542.1 hypothetical protein [Xanthomonadales bacterium]
MTRYSKCTVSMRSLHGVLGLLVLLISSPVLGEESAKSVVYEFPTKCALALSAVMDERAWGDQSSAMIEYGARHVRAYPDVDCVVHEDGDSVEVMFTNRDPMIRTHGPRFEWRPQENTISPARRCGTDDCRH